MRTRRQQIATWLEDSPTKRIAVAAAALIAFVISILNVSLTAYKEYQQAQLRPTIDIRARTSYPLRVMVSMDQLFGHAFLSSSGDAQPAPQTDTPYFPVVLSIHNPMDRRSSLSDCILRIRFYEREGTFESMGYMTVASLKSLELHEAPIATVDAGATARVEWLFFFLDHPKFEALLHDKTTQAFRFQTKCRDEAKRDILSAWR